MYLDLCTGGLDLCIAVDDFSPYLMCTITVLHPRALSLCYTQVRASVTCSIPFRSTYHQTLSNPSLTGSTILPLLPAITTLLLPITTLLPALLLAISLLLLLAIVLLLLAITTAHRLAPRLEIAHH